MEIRLSVIRPSYIYSAKSYNARLDIGGRAVVKSAPFGPLVEGLELIADVNVVANNIIERIASGALKVRIIAGIDSLSLRGIAVQYERSDLIIACVKL